MILLNNNIYQVKTGEVKKLTLDNKNYVSSIYSIKIKTRDKLFKSLVE